MFSHLVASWGELLGIFFLTGSCDIWSPRVVKKVMDETIWLCCFCGSVGTLFLAELG